RATASAATRASASVAVPAVTTVGSAGARASASSAALVDTRVMNSIVASVDRIAIDTIAGGRAGREATGFVRAGSVASASTAGPAATMIASIVASAASMIATTGMIAAVAPLVARTRRRRIFELELARRSYSQPPDTTADAWEPPG